ncbi:MAG: alkaline phosphatase, partial [Gammaproteobacteria bacterium]|nr:alkaline phosphatase [Gammaproteobacteria bacterium]
DPAFAHRVQGGVVTAAAEDAHSVHLEVTGLRPGREYFYRFMAGDATSPVGRTWTAPEAGAQLDRLRVGVASCQSYEQGYYHAWRGMMARGVDLVLHLGDYIYESGATDAVRRHDPGECTTLDGYRLRYAWYRSDPDLRAAHAACPWLMTWDDHEVDNDYAGITSENHAEQAAFPARRAAAYRAYWEHMPLPRSARPRDGGVALYRSLTLGGLATLHVLDTRQHRSPQVCPVPPRQGGGSRVFVDECPDWHAPGRTMLGAAQERWLDAGLRASRARWDLLAQSVVFTAVDEDPGPRVQHWSDSWAGYPAARQRLIDSVVASGARNPLALGGDIHAFIAADQRRQPGRPDAPVVMSELVTTSITSGPPPQRLREVYRRPGNDVAFYEDACRGYLWLELTPQRLEARLQGFDSVRDPDRAVERTVFSCGLEDGQRGLRT